jgi:hypothetical protein
MRMAMNTTGTFLNYWLGFPNCWLSRLALRITNKKQYEILKLVDKAFEREGFDPYNRMHYDGDFTEQGFPKSMFPLYHLIRFSDTYFIWQCDSNFKEIRAGLVIDTTGVVGKNNFLFNMSKRRILKYMPYMRRRFYDKEIGRDKDKYYNDAITSLKGLSTGSGVPDTALSRMKPEEEVKEELEVNS